MGETTGIAWTDSTQNFWIGCQVVGPGCDHCYAADLNKRTGGDNWGAHADRRQTVAKTQHAPLRWNAHADKFRAEHGHKQRVFCGSMMDIMDNAVPIEWAHDAFATMDVTPDLHWLPLTKRVGNVEKRIPDHWKNGHWPQHVGLMITVVNQEEADRDIPKLLILKAKFGIPWVGLSMEPLLGSVDIEWAISPNRLKIGAGLQARGHFSPGLELLSPVDWVIVGGESGPLARPANPEWYRELRFQCDATGAAFFFKQWGEWISVSEMEGEPKKWHQFEDGRTVKWLGKKVTGNSIDGQIHENFPPQLMT